jgi:hypothetical protein
MRITGAMRMSPSQNVTGDGRVLAVSRIRRQRVLAALERATASSRRAWSRLRWNCVSIRSIRCLSCCRTKATASLVTSLRWAGGQTPTSGASCRRAKKANQSWTSRHWLVLYASRSGVGGPSTPYCSWRGLYPARAAPMSLFMYEHASAPYPRPTARGMYSWLTLRAPSRAP